jgi:hypothetical protein
MSCNCNKVGVSDDHVNTNLYMENKPWLSGISYNISSDINKDYPNQCAWYYARTNFECNCPEGLEKYNGSRDSCLRNRYDWALSSHYCPN